MLFPWTIQHVEALPDPVIDKRSLLVGQPLLPLLDAGERVHRRGFHDVDPVGVGVDGVHHEFLHDRRRWLDDLAGGDAPDGPRRVR